VTSIPWYASTLIAINLIIVFLLLWSHIKGEIRKRNTERAYILWFVSLVCLGVIVFTLLTAIGLDQAALKLEKSQDPLEMKMNIVLFFSVIYMPLSVWYIEGYKKRQNNRKKGETLESPDQPWSV